MKDVSEARADWLARNALPHEPALRSWLVKWRPPGLEVDDIVQETYAILASCASVDDIRNPKNYMFQTARSIVLMHIRRSRVVSIQTVEDFDALDIETDVPNPEQQTSSRQELQRLADAIGKLPDLGRQAFMLRIVNGLSQREVGLKLGISENAAQKQIAKSLHFLMSFLGRGGTAELDASKLRNETDSGHVGSGNKPGN